MNTLLTLPSVHVRTVVTAMLSVLAVARPVAAEYDERIISNSPAFDLLVASDGQLYYIDQFGGEFGTLDVGTGTKVPLLSGLRLPYHMAEFQNRIYFTEFGTRGAEYRDGALSVFDPVTRTHARLREDLHAPASIEADSAGNLYVLEVPRTSSGLVVGTNRLLKFLGTSRDYEVVIDPMSFNNPLSLLLDEAHHRLFIGDGGSDVPGDFGSLIAYSLDAGTSENLLTAPPFIWDMEFDGRGNILVAAFGANPPPCSPFVGPCFPGGRSGAVSYVPPSLDQLIPLRTRILPWTVASDGAGSIYFATQDSIRVLSLPVPEPGTQWLLILGLSALAFSSRLIRFRRSLVPQATIVLFPLVAFAATAHADIFQWEYIDPANPSQGKRQSTALAPGGAGLNARPGAYVAGRDLTMAYLIGANLANADFGSKIEAQGSYWVEFPWGFERIRFVDFRDTRLSDADFTGTDVRGANFSTGHCPPGTLCSHYWPWPGWNPGAGITLAQLYSTASYQSGDLRGIRGVDLSDAITTNQILPDGHIDGLDLDASGMLLVRDYDDPRYDPARVIPIIVDQHLAMAPGGTLQMVFEADAWDSTISFAPDIPVALGGTLELTFANDVNLASQIGRTFDLFDWTGVNPIGAFAISSPYMWDLSNLYTTGEVTLVSIPESASYAFAASGALSLTLYRRRKFS